MTVILHMSQANVRLPSLTLAIYALPVKLSGMPAKRQDVHEMIMEDCRMSAKSVATNLGMLHVGILFSGAASKEKVLIKVDPATIDD